jgi:tetratricopeptide (TPR) repeat protein
MRQSSKPQLPQVNPPKSNAPKANAPKANALAVVLIAILALGYGAVYGWSSYAERRTLTEHARVEREAQAVIERKRDEEQSRIFDSVRLAEDHALPRHETPARAALLERLVAQTRAHIVVFPPSAPESRPGLDITARIAIARQLARLIEANTGEALPDPALVYEAAGSPRRAAIDEVPSFLHESKADWFITGIATHDTTGRMSVRLVKLPVHEAIPDKPSQYERAGIDIGDEQPPEAAFRPIASEALHALGVDVAAPPPLKEDPSPQLALGASPLDAEKAQQSALQGLWLQQLIGVLHPEGETLDTRARERLFERTASGLEDLTTESADRAVLAARANLYLDRPAAAASVLAKAAVSAGVKALGAYLRSDLVAMKAAVPQIERQVPRLIAECELLRLRAGLGELTDAEAKTEGDRLAASVPEGWRPLVVLFAAHAAAGDAAAVVDVKSLLDRDFALQRYPTEDPAAKDARTDTVVASAVAALTHAMRWREANAAALCCDQHTAAWRQFDRGHYLELLEAFVMADIVTRLDRIASDEGHPEAALGEADLYDKAWFHGAEPQLLGVRLRALQRLDAAHGGTPVHAEQQGELAKKILSWDSGQSPATADAFAVDTRLGLRRGRPSPLVLKRDVQDVDASLYDFPRRAQWSYRVAPALDDDGLRLAAARQGCRDGVGRIATCIDYLEQVRDNMGERVYRNEIALLIEPRFAGSAGRAIFLAEQQVAAGDVAGAQALLQEAIASARDQVRVYAALARLQMREGHYADAASTYLAYPGVRQPAANTAEVSTYLEQAARELLTHGAVPQAQQLLTVAAAFRDGSRPSLSAAAQLALIEGRFDAAVDALQALHQRHPADGGAARRLASLLFMLGRADEARGVLQAGQTRGDAQHANVIGLHLAKADADAIARAVAQDADRQGNYDAALWTGFRSVAIDRPAAAIRTLADVDTRARAVLKTVRVVHPPLAQIKEPAADGSFPPPAFVEGYALAKERSYARAMETLRPLFRADKPGQTPYARSHGLWTLLPYYALAVARSSGADEAQALEQRLLAEDAVSVSQPPVRRGSSAVPDFDRHLLHAVALAFKGNHADAMIAARKARAAMHGEGVLDAEYVFVEILERLSEETHEAGYLTEALDYARAYQSSEPWQSWAYAFEARHAEAGVQRARAAGIALKLDPQSVWLNEADQQTLGEAKEWAAASRWPQAEPVRAKAPARHTSS